MLTFAAIELALEHKKYLGASQSSVCCNVSYVCMCGSSCGGVCV